MKTTILNSVILLSLGLIGNLFESANGQTDPVITKWMKSTGTGYGGYTNNVLKVQYSTYYVYVNTNSIPSYSIGPWNNPNVAKGQDFTYKIPRNPTRNNGAKTSTPLGTIGILINGVSLFNAEDGMSYNNNGVWKRNAYYWEGSSFDSCLGHPQQSGNYHNHVNPKCLYAASSSSHSPLLGYAFDGYPIYGPYGYSSPLDSTSSIKRINPSYRLRSITKRTSLANGTALTSAQYGPDVSSSYPLGSFVQDYEYVSGIGDLDEYNGRICVTPEYPGGTYAYFITIDSNSNPAYPFILGSSYYGNVEFSNMGPNSGKITITEPVTTYYSYSTSGTVSTSASTTAQSSSSSLGPMLSSTTQSASSSNPPPPSSSSLGPMLSSTTQSASSSNPPPPSSSSLGPMPSSTTQSASSSKPPPPPSSYPPPPPPPLFPIGK